MAVNISSVVKGSIADRHGITGGERLLSINGHIINDIIDYKFYLDEPNVVLSVESQYGEQREISIKKRQYDDIGLEFETYLMDKQRSCRNKCVFCFIDQLPHGMRESLYFKDDDSRLSFLFGNYITLTNITEHEISRIIEMHICPVNISVHTTNPELRCKMMNNRFAGEALNIIKRFAQNGIKMNCQIVLCPELNDGDELRRTITDLCGLFPAIQSVAVVPVGLTGHRKDLYPLRGFTAQEAADVIDIIETYGGMYREKYGTRIVFPSDEFYLKAGRPLPDADFYEDFAQLENGVGICPLLEREFSQALEMCDVTKVDREVSIATGEAAAPLIERLCESAANKIKGFRYTVHPIKNEFFGGEIDVAGLVTGGDIIKQLKGKDMGEVLIFPSVMLRREGDVFLDDVTPQQISEELNVSVIPCDNDGFELLDVLLGV